MHSLKIYFSKKKIKNKSGAKTFFCKTSIFPIVFKQLLNELYSVFGSQMAFSSILSKNNQIL
jgi:hypothetical protein